MSDRGIYRLAGAVLVQAIQDAASNSVGRRTSAMRWINSNDQSSYSFRFVCRILSRDPEDVRRYCHRTIATRRNSLLPLHFLASMESSGSSVAPGLGYHRGDGRQAI